MLFPPKDRPQEEGQQDGALDRVMEILEWVGRIATLVLPFFYRLEAKNPRQIVALVVMGLALLFYYAGWLRYFVRGREYRLLFEPMAGLPVPLAINPVVVFGAAAVAFASWALAAATVVLGVAHIWISLRDARAGKGSKEQE
jgi:hypothetical protein